MPTTLEANLPTGPTVVESFTPADGGRVVNVAPISSVWPATPSSATVLVTIQRFRDGVWQHVASTMFRHGGSGPLPQLGVDNQGFTDPIRIVLEPSTPLRLGVVRIGG